MYKFFKVNVVIFSISTKKCLASLKQKLWVSKIPLIQLNADIFLLTMSPLSCREHLALGLSLSLKAIGGCFLSSCLCLMLIYQVMEGKAN